MSGRAGIILLRKYADAVAEMTADEAGSLLKAVFAYDAGSAVPEMSPFARAVFLMIRADMAEHAERYAKTCERNRQNAHKRWGKRTDELPDDSCGRMRADTAVCDSVRVHAAECDGCQEKGREERRSEEKEINVYMHAGSPNEGASAESEKIHALLTGDERERFERFWGAYPRRESRARAEEAWRELSPNEELTDKILEAVKAACTSDSRFQSRQYIPHPANWLRRREWESEYDMQASEEPDYGSWD